MDVNKDGKVSFPEFLLVMKHGNPVASMKSQDTSDVKMNQVNIINSDNNTYIHQQGTLKIQGLWTKFLVRIEIPNQLRKPKSFRIFSEIHKSYYTVGA